jgi:uncharacterized membrane protein YbhN (UPF0104 family)/tRNA A-37 threonylcarbamoyl transferase component Bud32
VAEPGGSTGTLTEVPATLARPATLHRTVHRRTVLDLRRLLWFFLVLAVGAALATGLDQTMAGIEADLLEVLARIPASVAGLAVAVVAVLYLVLLLGAPVALLVTRRFRTFGVATLAILLASLASRWVLDTLPVRTAELAGGNETAFVAGDAWPPSGALAAYTAAALVAGVELSRRWKRAVWAMLAVLALMRVLTAQEPPLDVPLSIAIGGVVGTGVLLVFGRTVRVASADGVRAALTGAGIAVTAVTQEDEDAGSWAFHVQTVTTALRVKVVGREDAQLDSLYRAYRRVRLRDVGDDTAYSSARRAVAVEALLSVYSADSGVRSPTVRAIAPMFGDEVLLAVEEVSGRPLDEVEDVALTDEVLQDCWQQVAGLRQARVAHRSLDLGHFLLDEQGRVWLLDYSFGQPAAEDHVLAGDVAELLAATYVRVGAPRAVAAAAGVLGTTALVDALSRIVPAALTRPTRAAVKKVDDGTEPLVHELCQVAGIDDPELAKVERLKPRYLVIGALLGVAVYFLLPQLANVPEMVATVQDADWRWVVPALVASALTYVGVGMAMSGATPGRTSLVEFTGVQLASSFVATFAPPGLGQLGLNLRYLQKRGFGGPLAVSVIASKEAVVFIVHIVMLAIVGVWAGRSGALDEELEKLPPLPVILAVIGGVLAAIGIAMLVPRVRAVVRERVVPSVKQSMSAMATVARNPVKITILFTGVTLLSVGYAACLYFSLEAFGAGASYAAVALVYLTAGTVASAAPTPGGLGAVEAILLAALTGIGIASPTALAGIFLYRFATFWLPILPGLAAFRWLTARDAI